MDWRFDLGLVADIFANVDFEERLFGFGYQNCTPKVSVVLLVAGQTSMVQFLPFGGLEPDWSGFDAYSLLI